MRKIDLTEGNVLKVILFLSAPIVGTSLLQFTYSVVDMLFIGRLGSDAVASIGTASFLLGLGYSIQSLVIIGCGVKVSHAIGKKSDVDTQAYIDAGFRLNLYIGLIYGLSMILFGKELISFFQLNNPKVENSSYSYLAISAPMMFFSFFNVLYSRIMGSFGNNHAALKLSAVGIVLNIILDPIFIYGLDLGVNGAAITTLLGNFVVLLLFYYRTKVLFKVNFWGKIHSNKVRNIIKLGLPMSSQRLLFTVVNILLARLIASHGTDAIAAQKIGLQIESIALMVLGGLNGAISSFIGQNYGAKKFSRINQGYYTTIMIGFVYSSILGLIFFLVPEWLVGLFINDAQTTEMANNYLRYIGAALIFSGVEMISNGAFTGVGLSTIPAMISISFTILRIPLAILLIPYMGVNGIWMSIALTSILKGLLAAVLFKYKVWGKYKHVESFK